MLARPASVPYSGQRRAQGQRDAINDLLLLHTAEATAQASTQAEAVVEHRVAIVDGLISIQFEARPRPRAERRLHR